MSAEITGPGRRPTGSTAKADFENYEAGTTDRNVKTAADEKRVE